MNSRSTNSMYRVLMAALVFALAWTVAGCGGGGGGGGGETVDRGTVQGIVLVNGASGLEPLANVTVSAGGSTTTTNTDGEFSLTNVPVTTTVGTLTAAGYTSRTITITLTRAGQVQNVGNLVMVANPNTGTTGTVTGVVRIQGIGSAAAGARVAMGDTFQYSAFCNSAGQFTIEGVPITLRRIKVFGNKVEGGFHDAYLKLDYGLVAGPPATNNIGTIYVTSYSSPPPPPPFDW